MLKQDSTVLGLDNVYITRDVTCQKQERDSFFLAHNISLKIAVTFAIDKVTITRDVTGAQSEARWGVMQQLFLGQKSRDFCL